MRAPTYLRGGLLVDDELVRQDLLPGERLGSGVANRRGNAFSCSPRNHHTGTNQQGDESTSQAGYAGSIPVIGSIVTSGDAVERRFALSGADATRLGDAADERGGYPAYCVIRSAFCR